MIRNAIPLALSSLLLACGSDSGFESAPADFAGVYTLSLTYRGNGCAFPEWEEGAQASGVTLTVTQSGAEATGEVSGGGAGLALWALTGSTTMRGTVEESSIELGIEGVNLREEEEAPECQYWVDATASAELTGDTLNGSIRYVRRVMPGATCAAASGCESIQDLAGSRAPR